MANNKISKEEYNKHKQKLLQEIDRLKEKYNNILDDCIEINRTIDYLYDQCSQDHNLAEELYFLIAYNEEFQEFYRLFYSLIFTNNPIKQNIDLLLSEIHPYMDNEKNPEYIKSLS